MNSLSVQSQHKKLESCPETKGGNESNVATVHLRAKKSVPKSAIKTHDSRGFQNPQVQYLCAKESMPAKYSHVSDNRNSQPETRSKPNKVIFSGKDSVPLNRDGQNRRSPESNDFKNNREKNTVVIPHGHLINEVDQSNQKVIKSNSRSQKHQKSASKSPNIHRFDSKTEENDFIANMKKNFYTVVEENKRLKADLSTSQSKCRAHISHGETLIVNNKLDQNRMTVLSEENSELKRQIEQYKAQLATTRSDLREKIISHKDENFMSIENAHLKEENARLFLMLKSTSEYKNFASFADHEHRLRYLKDLNFFRHLDQTGNATTTLANSNCHRQIDVEKYLWVPEESFRLLHKISTSENLGLSDTMIDFILFELNKIWKVREEYIISKTHVFCKNCSKPTNKRNPDSLPISLSADAKDKRIARLESELAQTQSKLSAAQKLLRKNDKGIFNVQENKALAQNLKLIQRSNSEQKALVNKNKFLTEINVILRKQLDEHLLRNFYKLQGWNENGDLMSH
jgi:hypothetical protein